MGVPLDYSVPDTLASAGQKVTSELIPRSDKIFVLLMRWQLPIWVDLQWCQWWAHLLQEWCQLVLGCGRPWEDTCQWCRALQWWDLPPGPWWCQRGQKWPIQKDKDASRTILSFVSVLCSSSPEHHGAASPGFDIRTVRWQDPLPLQIAEGLI